MKKTLVALAALLVVGAASATCKNGATNYPKCDDNVPPVTTPVTTPGSTATSTSSGGNSTSDATAVGLGQAMGLGYGEGGKGGAANAVNGPNTNTNANTALGGNSLAGVLGSGNSRNNIKASNDIRNSNDLRNTNANLQGQAQQQRQHQNLENSGNNSSRSGVNGSGNGTGTASIGNININTDGVNPEGTRDLGVPSQTTVDASDRSTTEYRAIVIPSVVPATPPSTVGNSTIVKETGVCGPLQVVVRQPVIGQFHGFWTTNEVPQGFTETLDPEGYVDPVTKNRKMYHLIDGKLYGHQVTQFTTVVGVSGARNIAFGGGSSTGSWGQGGGGASGAAQQMVTTIQLALCEVPSKVVMVPSTPIIREVPVKRLGE